MFTRIPRSHACLQFSNRSYSCLLDHLRGGVFAQIGATASLGLPLSKPPEVRFITPSHLPGNSCSVTPFPLVTFPPTISPFPLPPTYRGLQVNPDDDSTVSHSVHPLSARLINEPRDEKGGLCAPWSKPLPPDHPAVAADVQDLEASFASALEPTEVAFHLQNHMAALTAKSVAANAGGPPKNFLQAHSVIIDALLMDPSVTVTRLATITGYSRNWLHKVISSDAFAAKYAERQKSVIDPLIAASIKDRLNGLASRSLEVLEERMESDTVPLDAAMNVFSMAAKALGIGAQKNVAPVTQQFIVHVPTRITSATDWATQHSGRPAETVVDPLDIPIFEPDTPPTTEGEQDESED